jgi:hypothetical protein
MQVHRIGEYEVSAFKLPHEKRDAWLLERRADVMLLLRDSTRTISGPGFLAKKVGRVGDSEDLRDMIYGVFVFVLLCPASVRLMYVTDDEG